MLESAHRRTSRGATIFIWRTEAFDNRDYCEDREGYRGIWSRVSARPHSRLVSGSSSRWDSCFRP